MRVMSVLLILWGFTAVGGCERDSESKSATAAPPAVVYRGLDGRTLSQEELKGMTGTFNYEIVGGEDVPARARELHELARAAGVVGSTIRPLSCFGVHPKWRRGGRIRFTIWLTLIS